MAQNIVLEAFLDTSNLESKLKRIQEVGSTQTGKVLNTLGATISNDLQRRTKAMAAGVRDIESSAMNAKRNGLFGDIKGISAADKDLKTLMNDHRQLNTLIKQTQEAYKKIQSDALRNRTPAFKEAFKNESITGVELRRFKGEAGFTGAPLGLLKKATQGLQEINEIASAYDRANNAANKLQKTVTGGYKPMVNMLNRLGVPGNSLVEIFSTLAGKVTTWLIATSGIFMTIRLVTALVKNMKELEDATVSLQRVLPSVGDSLDRDTESAMKFAKTMNALAASTYKETLTALENAVQAGFSLADSMELAKAAILAANVTELESGDAARYMIATIRQFNLETKDSLWILNQWNELATRTGATTRDIAEGVSRTGKAWQAAGGSLAQLNAVVAATVESTGQSGEKIGTMLQTLSARYSDLNRGQSVNNVLSEHGIRVQQRNSTAQNDIFEVLRQVSAQWKGLNKEQQANIAKAFAGTRQYSKFIGVVDNFDSVMKALFASIDSGNSVMTENERRTTSLSFALNQLKGSFDEMALSSTGLMNILKKGVRIATSLLDVLNMIAGNQIGQFLLSTTALLGVTIIATKVLSSTLMFLATNTLVKLIKALAGVRAEAMMLNVLKGPLGWISLLAIGIGMLATNFNFAKRAKDAFLDGTTAELESLIQNRRDLLGNSDTALKMYIDPDTDSEMKSTIATMYKNVAGIDIIKEFRLSSNTTKSIESIRKQIKDGLSNESILQMLSDNISSKGNKEQKLYIESIMKSMDGKDILTETSKLLTDARQKQILGAVEDSFRDTKNNKIIIPISEEIKILETLEASTTPVVKVFEDAVERIRTSAEEIQDITKNMYKSIIDAALALDTDNTFLDNITNAFAALGDIVYTEMKNSMVLGMENAIKEAVWMDEFKMNIRDATTDAFKGIQKFLFEPRTENKDGSITGGGILQGQKDLIGTLMAGVGGGAFTAGATGRDQGTGALVGAGISALMTLNPVTAPFSLIGGLIGGLFSPQNKKDEADDRKETLDLQRESTKQLKLVNRNLQSVIENMDPYSMSESYYFSVSNNRGLAV